MSTSHDGQLVSSLRYFASCEIQNITNGKINDMNLQTLGHKQRSVLNVGSMAWHWRTTELQRCQNAWIERPSIDVRSSSSLHPVVFFFCLFFLFCSCELCGKQ